MQSSKPKTGINIVKLIKAPADHEEIKEKIISKVNELNAQLELKKLQNLELEAKVVEEKKYESTNVKILSKFYFNLILVKLF
jgi:hypothetical protein